MSKPAEAQGRVSLSGRHRVLALLVAGVLLVAAPAPAFAAVPDSPAAADELARRYAPVVFIHPQEKYGPQSVDFFLSQSTLRWWRFFFSDRLVADLGEVVPERLGSECRRAPGGCYASEGFLVSQMTRPHDGRRTRASGLSTREGFALAAEDSVKRGETGAPKAPIFYEVESGRRTRIAYWFFFGYSAPYRPLGIPGGGRVLSHQGDWENIEVVLGRNLKPQAVLYFSHGKTPQRVDWFHVCKAVAGGEDCASSRPGRPVVYSALQSHASYPTQGETPVCLKGSHLCSEDLRKQGPRWDPLSPSGSLRDVRAEGWYGFGGSWGKAGRLGSNTTGPLGPSSYKWPDDPTEANPFEPQ